MGVWGVVREGMLHLCNLATLKVAKLPPCQAGAGGGGTMEDGLLGRLEGKGTFWTGGLLIV